jgi:hypothetical protein
MNNANIWKIRDQISRQAPGTPYATICARGRDRSH